MLKGLTSIYSVWLVIRWEKKKLNVLVHLGRSVPYLYSKLD